MRFSQMQDELNALGYTGLINLLIIRGDLYTTGSYDTGCKVPSLWPSDDGRTKLGTEAGIGVALRNYEAVILDASGNFHLRYYRIYPGLGYTLTDPTDYTNIRDALIARAHADGLYPPFATVMSPNGGETLAVGASTEITWGTAGAGGNAKIELFKGGVLHSTLEAATPNDGSYTWNIASDHELGTNFTVKVTPLLAPAKADESDADFTIANPVYMALMDTDPGWTHEGEWGYGAPSIGEGYYQPPVPPTSAHSGSFVIGYDVDGVYATNLPGALWTTTPTFDCSDRTGVTVTFWQYVGTWSGDQLQLQAKNGGGSWQTVWQTTSRMNIGSWQYVSYDVSSVADGQSGVQLRFGLGPTQSTYWFCGWYIDDLIVLGDVVPPPTTSNGTPHSWLEDHGITSNQEAEDVADQDGDGLLTWMEYQAGTDPTNPASVFCILSIDILSNSNGISWFGTTNSGVTTDFIIYRATDLVSSNWTPVGTNSRSASGTNSWWDPSPPPGVPAYYRAVVPLP